MNQPQHDPKGGPSAAPAQMQCAAFIPDPAGSEHADLGTLKHAWLSYMLTHQHEIGVMAPPTEELCSDDGEQVEWVAQYISDNCPPVLCTEEDLHLIGDDFTERTWGTIDVGCADGVIVDAKFGEERDYSRQMAIYAFMWMTRQRLTSCNCHVVYGRLRRAEVLDFTLDKAASLTYQWLNQRDSADKTPTPCAYCGWCKDRLACPAVAGMVEQVAHGYSDTPLETYHASEVSDPNTIARMLAMAKVVGDWADSVKHHATKLALDEGVNIPGYTIRSRSGGWAVDDMQAAFERSGLDAPAFLSACTCSIPKLADAFAAAQGMPKAKAKNELIALLDGAISEKPGTKFLQKTKE